MPQADADGRRCSPRHVASYLVRLKNSKSKNQKPYSTIFRIEPGSAVRASEGYTTLTRGPRGASAPSYSRARKCGTLSATADT
ncbi:hypothetical protein EVAR_6235_1 [Eumeta japonica]|uniref:Uncharacterized protein n=1 Tax=Eumeta variegata TaxID=151549 RepID=A0A4C1T954_EUMVA|nr:hypothetical protein EVAR_6235_1 [Eumeta japonica]